MKIALDHQIFSQQAYGGISRYFVRLAEGLMALGHDVNVIAPIHQNRYLERLPKASVHTYAHVQYPPKMGHLVSLANRYLSKRTFFKIAPDIIHETYFSSIPVGASAAGRVITVHDMIHEKFASKFTRLNRTSKNKRLAIERADHIICVSHSTKIDVCDLLNVPEDKISIVHHGFERFDFDSDVSETYHGRGRPFLLYVGHRGGYKNFDSMLRAVASNISLMKNFDIVAFGGGKFRPCERALIDQLGFTVGSVRQLGGGDDVLGRLYSCARAFVYPSIYEGFGLPPLEAMAHDCPVITSCSSSMPEVVGDAGVYFDPIDIDSQADAISRVVFDDELRAWLVAAGRLRLKLFSWQRSARGTLDVYQTVLRDKGRR